MAALRGLGSLYRSSRVRRMGEVLCSIQQPVLKNRFNGSLTGLLPVAAQRGLHVGYVSSAKAAAANKKEAKKAKRPVDDVYLQDLYDPEIYSIEDGVSTMKRYMELDLADHNSLVYLKLELHLAPKGKGKHQSFWAIEEPKHKFDYVNKICVFTQSADEIKQCYDHGAHFAGEDDIIQRILFTRETCDAYVSTQQYKKTVLDKNAEMGKIMGKLAPTKTHGIASDVIAELLRLRDGMIVHNQTSDNWHSRVVVGLIEQPANHLTENILQAIALVRQNQNPKHPPIVKAAEIVCCEEAIPVDVSIDDD